MQQRITVVKENFYFLQVLVTVKAHNHPFKQFLSRFTAVVLNDPARSNSQEPGPMLPDSRALCLSPTRVIVLLCHSLTHS